MRRVDPFFQGEDFNLPNWDLMQRNNGRRRERVSNAIDVLICAIFVHVTGNPRQRKIFLHDAVKGVFVKAFRNGEIFVPQFERGCRKVHLFCRGNRLCRKVRQL